MESNHNRMPLILPREVEATWPYQGIEEAALLTDLLVPYAAEEIEAYRVSTRVNSPAPDTSDCIVAIGSPV